MTALPFEKWEGLGNDFLVVDEDVVRRVFGASLVPSDVVRALCDRRRGVGGDGVLVAGRRPGGGSMVVLNADGSRPEMCGNGLRCVAGWLDPAAREALVSVDTDAGPRRCKLELRADGTFDVEVSMGPVRLGPPLAFDGGGRHLELATADVGNPHAITFEPFDDAAIDALGPRIATTPAAGVNVEFCRPIGAPPALERIDVVVWERGVGRTLACGTGACAVAGVACARGLCAYDAPVTIRLPGGDLSVTIARATNEASMRGPARRAFAGEVALP